MIHTTVFIFVALTLTSLRVCLPSFLVKRFMDNIALPRLAGQKHHIGCQTVEEDTSTQLLVRSLI